jgi:Ca2+/Na+ antiporter
MIKFLMRVLSKMYWPQRGNKDIFLHSRHLYDSMTILFLVTCINLGVLINTLNINFFSIYWIHIFFLLIFFYLIFLGWVSSYKQEELRGYLLEQKSKEDKDILDTLANIYVAINLLSIIFLWFRMLFI